jgi:hypothetical protein
MHELRCNGRLHGRLDAERGTLEVTCPRRGCGAQKGVVVLHTFDIITGQLLDTELFRTPQVGRRG